MQTYSEFKVNSEYIFGNKPEPKLKPFIFGSFNAQFLPLLTSFTITMTIVITYVIAVYQGDVSPFPNTDITHTAIGYPQYLVFRIGGLCSIPMIILVIIMEYWHLSNIIKFHTNFYQRRAPISIVILGVVAATLFALSTSTIDKDQMNWILHVIGATGFFIMIYIDFIIITHTMCKIRHHSADGYKLIPDRVFYTKLVIVILLTLTFALDIYNGFKHIAPYIGDACEWAGAFLVILYIASFFHDFEKFELGLEKPVKQ